MRRPVGIAESIKAFTRWAFWRAWYFFANSRGGRPAEFLVWLKQSDRKRWPWWTFKPCLRHNDDGNMWHVYFSDEDSYTARHTLPLDVHISRETGKIVGFNVWDETLQTIVQKEVPCEV